ncbi:cupin domain-containing protein [Pseudobacteriovorax antillogorgiicola]|uniref:Cupin domain-containing protein n=1 Tax=Pseudobacteriovorax antillogorgiicola TaxID=1513793 RepID=A0A1Y6BEF5_9BACT|nr:cupin domain-containing protein [Pseudobacteriovorax antillogorgiicola]TCS57554.1 cupin domain [Pseudobacteriovorax antillogorgiicola]SME99794.1 Cupin domain-containing protein [Pseudobacteriovorax antillogorgiicola]
MKQIRTLKSTKDEEDIKALYKAHYWAPGESDIFEAPSDHLYHFSTYIGEHTITVEKGDCVYLLDDKKQNVSVHKGPKKITSSHWGIVIRGFMPPDQTVSIEGLPHLPYVNGCSTKQLIYPPRPGDPTLQYLNIPAHSAEQAHHIHSTVRVVYVLKGKGVSIVGMEGKQHREELIPGKVCILEPMCPHHFETPFDESLVVIPLHVFSSASSFENQHPMYSGTFLMNQGSR